MTSSEVLWAGTEWYRWAIKGIKQTLLIVFLETVSNGYYYYYSTTTKIVPLTSLGFFSCNPKVLARAIIYFLFFFGGGENQIDWRSIPCLIKFLFIFLIKQINKGMSIGQWSLVSWSVYIKRELLPLLLQWFTKLISPINHFTSARALLRAWSCPDSADLIRMRVLMNLYSFRQFIRVQMLWRTIHWWIRIEL